MSERGTYRSVYSRLIDDVDFLALSPSARHVLLTARVSKEAGPSGIFIYALDILARRTGRPPREVSRSLEELQRAAWVVIEDPILWIRNALRYDPAITLTNPKHRKGIEAHIRELPRKDIILKFCDYYQFAYPFESLSHTHSNGYAIPYGIGYPAAPVGPESGRYNPSESTFKNETQVPASLDKSDTHWHTHSIPYANQGLGIRDYGKELGFRKGGAGGKPPPAAQAAEDGHPSPGPLPRIEFHTPEAILEALRAAPHFRGVPSVQQSAFWQAELRANPTVDFVREIHRAEAWLTANPHKPRKHLSRFLHNWLGQADRPDEEA